MYHVNSKGDPGKCEAKAGNCPFGGESSHYETIQQADNAIATVEAMETFSQPEEGFRYIPAITLYDDYPSRGESVEQLQNILDWMRNGHIDNNMQKVIEERLEIARAVESGTQLRHALLARHAKKAEVAYRAWKQGQAERNASITQPVPPVAPPVVVAPPAPASTPMPTWEPASEEHKSTASPTLGATPIEDTPGTSQATALQHMEEEAAGNNAWTTSEAAHSVLSSQNGYADVPALFTADGRVASLKSGWQKSQFTPNKSVEYWVLNDDIAQATGNRFVNPSSAKNPATRHRNLLAKGYTTGTVRVKAYVRKVNVAGDYNPVYNYTINPDRKAVDAQEFEVRHVDNFTDGITLAGGKFVD